MNSVQKIEPDPSEDVLDMYDHVRNGGGLVCSGMAELYYTALRLNHLPARRVSLKRNLLSKYDTHETVEVLVKGKWVIFDPTFNISFQKNGQLIGAQEIENSLLDGSYNQIKTVFYGDVRYPQRIENYYMNWLSLFNNVFIVEVRHNSILGKIPPFRYWFGTVAYYEKIPGHAEYPYVFLNDLYIVFVVIIPIIIFLLFIYLLMMNSLWKIRREIKDHNGRIIL